MPVASASVQLAPVPIKPKTPGSIAWMTSERDARLRSQREGRPMIVWARAEWAATAIGMEREVWSDPRVVEAAAPFVALKLDLTEAEGDSERYAEHYRITAMPMTVLVSGQGARLSELKGRVDVEALVTALRDAAR